MAATAIAPIEVTASMASGSPIRTRSDRVASFSPRSAPWHRGWQTFASRDRLQRLALASAGLAVIWLVTRGWEPPFAYRTGFVPTRAIVARVPFAVIDEERTRDKRQQAFRETPAYYTNNAGKFHELADPLLADLLRLIEIENLAQIPAGLRARWPELSIAAPAAATPAAATPAAATPAPTPPVPATGTASEPKSATTNAVPATSSPQAAQSTATTTAIASTTNPPASPAPPAVTAPATTPTTTPDNPAATAPAPVSSSSSTDSAVNPAASSDVGSAVATPGKPSKPENASVAIATSSGAANEFTRLLPELRAAFAGKTGEATLRQAIGVVFQ
ncbi:MAG: hypothetical protein ACKO38_07190, partial [Planctomycetota bacterium]